MEHDISMKNCSCHHISTSRWKEFRTHFFFNNLFDAYFWQRGGKNVVHIFVYQREVQVIYLSQDAKTFSSSSVSIQI